MGLSEFESESLAPKAMSYGEKQSINITKDAFNQYLDILDINGIGHDWKYSIDKCILQPYFEYLDWRITFRDTLEYLKIIKDKHSLSYYRKEVYQIRKFLEYLGIDWAIKLNPPSEPIYLPKRITIADINNTLSHFKDNQYFIQIKSLILLGISSGMRAEELYQLNIDDIDLDSGIVHINHNPSNGQSTKTKISRISFFTNNTKDALYEYFTYFRNVRSLKQLFSQSHITRLFRDAPIQVKDLRKYFSQEWDRRGGPTSIKKILMGHSLKGDVDLMHYNAQSEEDLKRIYDKVMGDKSIVQ